MGCGDEAEAGDDTPLEVSGSQSQQPELSAAIRSGRRSAAAECARTVEPTGVCVQQVVIHADALQRLQRVERLEHCTARESGLIVQVVYNKNFENSGLKK